jgi:hypothetical protein
MHLGPASSRRFGSVAMGALGAVTATEAFPRSRIAWSIFSRWPRETPRSFEVLISQMAKDGKIAVVIGKGLSILSHAEFFEPVCNLLHSRTRGSRRGRTSFRPRRHKVYTETRRRARLAFPLPCREGLTTLGHRPTRSRRMLANPGWSPTLVSRHCGRQPTIPAIPKTCPGVEPRPSSGSNFVPPLSGRHASDLQVARVGMPKRSRALLT